MSFLSAILILILCFSFINSSSCSDLHCCGGWMYFLPHLLPGNSTLRRGAAGEDSDRRYAPPLTAQSFLGYSVAFHTLDPKTWHTLSMIGSCGWSSPRRTAACPSARLQPGAFSSSGVPLPKCSKKKSCCDSVHSSSMTRRDFHRLGIFLFRLGEHGVFRAAALVGDSLSQGSTRVLVVGISLVAVHLRVKQGIAQFALVAILQIHVVVGTHRA